MSEKQMIVSVGREYGSGGHAIAEILASRFQLPFYDKNLLEEVATGKNVNVKNLEKYDEIPRNLFMSRTVRGFSNSPEENIAGMQFDYLRKLAKEGASFVIVGRCAENILKGTPALISFFVLGDEEAKKERISRLYHVSAQGALDMMREQDKIRKMYHNYFCDCKWGDSRNYDFSINSSRLGVEDTADVMEDYIRRRIAKM